MMIVKYINQNIIYQREIYTIKSCGRNIEVFNYNKMFC